jgi:hypothetical protein
MNASDQQGGDATAGLRFMPPGRRATDNRQVVHRAGEFISGRSALLTTPASTPLTHEL